MEIIDTMTANGHHSIPKERLQAHPDHPCNILPRAPTKVSDLRLRDLQAPRRTINIVHRDRNIHRIDLVHLQRGVLICDMVTLRGTTPLTQAEIDPHTPPLPSTLRLQCDQGIVGLIAANQGALLTHPMAAMAEGSRLSGVEAG